MVYLMVCRMPGGRESVLTSGSKQRIEYLVEVYLRTAPDLRAYRCVERDAWWMQNYGHPYHI